VTPVLALLASPFLGPAVWQTVADGLVASGRQVVVPQWPASAPRSPQDVLEAFLGALPPDRDLVLVPHSNAGLFAPALAMRRRVTGFVFVDARLPLAPGELAMVPPALLEALRSTADAQGCSPGGPTGGTRPTSPRSSRAPPSGGGWSASSAPSR